jgi:hypothetical protein
LVQAVLAVVQLVTTTPSWLGLQAGVAGHYRVSHLIYTDGNVLVFTDTVQRAVLFMRHTFVPLHCLSTFDSNSLFHKAGSALLASPYTLFKLQFCAAKQL